MTWYLQIRKGDEVVHERYDLSPEIASGPRKDAEAHIKQMANLSPHLTYVLVPDDTRRQTTFHLRPEYVEALNTLKNKGKKKNQNN